ncbi:MAG: purine-binding chemotaxis protein CheW [Desulfobacterales bacterium]|jgi:chemotaxis-related protein WspB|nr:purine-binding chemotaxis protein CheW [Desulfobacterales bacterium]
MLALLFYLGDTMYTMKCEKVREVAPMVKLKQVPHTPDYFAGLFNYRGVIVPVIDLRRLIQGQPCQMRFSTRIILVDYVRDDHTPYILGLMAERVTEAVRKSENAFVSPGLSMQEAPFLGGFVMENKEMIQYIDLDLLPNSFRFLPMIEGGNNVPDDD